MIHTIKPHYFTKARFTSEIITLLGTSPQLASCPNDKTRIFLLSLLGDLEFRSLGEVGDFLLRNKRCCVAQQRGDWLRKALGGAS
jgi:hypothetical protein